MYKFDPQIDALSAPKERFVWLVFMGILFFLLYGASNQFSGITAPHPSYFMQWETKIPFIEVFIIPYMSSDLMFVLAFLLPYTRRELRVLAFRVLFIVAMSCFIFLIFPLQFAFEKPEIQSFKALFTALTADLPYNQLPSLHISFAVVLYASMKEHLNNIVLKFITLVWFFLITLSTLFVYQHHFIDIPTGFIMGFLAVFLIRKQDLYIENFMTPRSLKMGLYFLFASVLFMVLSFNAQGILVYFSLWIFFSLLSLSLIYAFGFNTCLAGSKAKANVWQWIVFFPYFFGSYLSWIYYKRKIPLVSQVHEKVYFGRHPSKKEYATLKDYKLKHIINLATEQQFKLTDEAQTRFPFLDQTIQSPETLHAGVMKIQEYKEEGVYVHCALGLSRSVLLISSWLLFNNHTREEIDTLMKKIRPQYISSKYMSINLDIYENYLKNKDKQ